MEKYVTISAFVISIKVLTLIENFLVAGIVVPYAVVPKLKFKEWQASIVSK